MVGSKRKDLGVKTEPDASPVTKKPKAAHGKRDLLTLPSEKREPGVEYLVDPGIPQVSDFNMTRVRCLTPTTTPRNTHGGVVYWMSRDQRAHQNWALLYAQRLARQRASPLYVVFSLVPKFLDATIRHFDFMLKGLQETSTTLKEHDIPFYLLTGKPGDTIAPFIAQHDVSAVVTDFSPLRVPLQWCAEVATDLQAENVPLYQVDAHNVVPVWVASGKLEYAARTIRPKIMNRLPEYLTPFPDLEKQKLKGEMGPEIDWQAALASLEVDRTVKPVEWAEPGYRAGMTMADNFITRRLKHFDEKRNNPNNKALSNMSPWFHFGQVSVQEVIRQVKKHGKSHSESVKSYVEEAVVRRELSDNFCFHCPHYDSLRGGYAWAVKTLKDHEKDKREYVYNLDELTKSKTHDDLWNAAQKQLVQTGKMHGFLRMYWCKKILEWTPNAKTALEYSIHLNDRYSLDGRDPNGYVGVMWSIVGIHDRGWTERDIFGKIRFMNYKGCQRKFDVPGFVNMMDTSVGLKFWKK